MWLEKIINAKKDNNITTKMMSERSHSHIPIETINRILSGKTKTPRIDTVLELGEAVGLSASELFAETTSVIVEGGEALCQGELNRYSVAFESLSTESLTLQKEIEELRQERVILQLKLDHKDELLKIKDELIAALKK